MAGDKELKDNDSNDMRRAIGFRGEDLAVEELGEKGIEIVARNYETKLGELDIVGRQFERVFGRTEETYVFIEVKSRRTKSGPPPEVGVDHRKRGRIIRLARLFLQREKVRRVNVRFDVVAVDLSDDEPQVVHFEGAFDADGTVC